MSNKTEALRHLAPLASLRIEIDLRVDIRERLDFMRRRPTECAIGREAFLAQVVTWLIVGGVDPVVVEKTFYPDKLSNLSVTLSGPLMDFDLSWTFKIIDKAFALLPDPCVVKISREVSHEA